MRHAIPEVHREWQGGRGAAHVPVSFNNPRTWQKKPLLIVSVSAPSRWYHLLDWQQEKQSVDRADGYDRLKNPSMFCTKVQRSRAFCLLVSFYTTFYGKILFVCDVNSTISSPLLSKHDSEVWRCRKTPRPTLNLVLVVGIWSRNSTRRPF